MRRRRRRRRSLQKLDAGSLKQTTCAECSRVAGCQKLQHEWFCEDCWHRRAPEHYPLHTFCRCPHCQAAEDAEEHPHGQHMGNHSLHAVLWFNTATLERPITADPG